MFKPRLRLPSPALVIAMVALALVLGGTAIAAGTAAPLTKATGTKLIKKLAPTLSVKHAKGADKLGGVAASGYATKTPLSFTSPSLLNSWTSGAGFVAPGYAKDQFGTVHLTGAVHNNSASSAVMFTLPAGFRPAASIDAPVAVYGPTVGLIRIESNGDVSVISGATQFVDFDGINFQAGG